MHGQAGNDTLLGGDGNDKLFGGAGDDTFVFDLSVADELDVMRDFNHLEGDRILLSGMIGMSGDMVEIISCGNFGLLQVNTNDGPVRLAKIMGNDIGALEILQQSDDFFIFG